MPSLLSRFKNRSSSQSSNLSDDLSQSSNTHDRSSRRASTASSSGFPSTSYSEGDGDDDDTSSSARPLRATTTTSPKIGRGGSSFLEDFDENLASPLATSTPPIPHNKRQQTSDTITPSSSSGFLATTANGGGGKHIPSPLSVPDSAQKPLIGTPKLVLTQDGSDSPRSFSSSPHPRGASRGSDSETSGLGLGLEDQSERRTSISFASSATEEDQTPRNPDDSLSAQQSRSSMASAPTASAPTSAAAPVYLESVAPASRSRSGSLLSAGNESGRHSRSGSIVNRSTKSPVIVSESKEDKKDKKKKRKKRGMSGSSGMSGSIAAALGKAAMPGLHIGSHSDAVEGMSVSSGKRGSVPPNRSPWLVRGGQDDDSKMEGDDTTSSRQEYYDDDDDDDDDDDSSDFEEHLPVTGFAVASNRRNAEFHGMFPAVDEGDYLIEDYGCAMSKDILVQGRLYVSENHICFHANIFGWVTDLVLPFADIRIIEKKMTALVIPNAISVVTQKGDKYTFASFISRDTTYDVLMNIWRLCNPNAVMSTTSFHGNGSRPASVNGDAADGATTAKGEAAGGGGEAGEKGHKKTECACGKKGDHYSEVALDTTFGTTPEKCYNLMFNSGWFKNFLSETMKLRDIETSDWSPAQGSTKLLTRSTSYIKPLNGSIGPKQTKCHIVDEQDHCEYEDYVSMVTTTKTPDVPSGGVFSVKTRTCLTWAGGKAGTKVLVTTTVEWTGKSWVKGIIEKSAIDGQKQYHDELSTGMRAHIKEHHSEFAIAGASEDDEEGDAEGGAAAADGSGEKGQPTEAEAYAAREKAKRDRKDQDVTYLSAAIDGTVSGAKMIGSAMFDGGKALFDLLSDMGMGPKETIMGSLIVLLLISNLWTWMAYSSHGAKEARLARRTGKGLSSGRGGGADGDLEDVVRRVLQRQGVYGGGLTGGGLRGVKEEVGELTRLLDEVERRAGKLREEVEHSKSKSAVGVQDDLD